MSGASELTTALAECGIELPPEQLAQLDRYRALLWEWNERLNLTRHTDYEKFAARDVVDSLQLAALLEEGEKVLDLGTGGGVPGVILAIVRPDLKVSLAESVIKRARAVDDIVSRLGLNVGIFAQRAEVVLEKSHFTSVVARAVAPLPKLLTWLDGHWEAAGRLLAIKGSRWVEERGECRHRGLLKGLGLRRLATYETPGTGAENVILQIRPEPDDTD